MNIKSLLLGSAAVLVAASTAQAADAIIVEPEPVEYVRICDAYGSGYFYIPGTETCMRIGGHVRSTYRHNTDTIGGVEQPDHAAWNYRAGLAITVSNETDWGTLTSQLEIQSTGGNGGADDAVTIDRALILVAGFRLGYNETYWTTNHNYGQGPAIVDGFYDYDQGLLFDYTWAGDGFAVTVGVNDIVGGAAAENPDYYVGGKYTGDWGYVAATYVYDQRAVNQVSGAVGGGAWKVSAELQNIGDSGWNFGGWYANDGDNGTAYVNGGGSLAAAPAIALLVEREWALQINGPLADNLTGYATYSHADAISTSATYIDSSQLAVGLVWRPITGLAIQTEYYSQEADFVLAANDNDSDGFRVRVTRSW